jgi:GrpB-like predicted nucleotidyltransferase (UPF0157 family)
MDEERGSSGRVLPYDGEAPRIFEEIKRFLLSIIPFKVEVEHVGSTAVPGLPGKGIIDLLIITRQERMWDIVKLLESRGFRYNPEGGNPPERLFVSGPYRYKNEELHIHLHIAFGSKEHQDQLLFRDYLRRHPEEAERYYELKKQWDGEAGSDNDKYGELKTPYINEVLEKARKEKLQS